MKTWIVGVFGLLFSLCSSFHNVCPHVSQAIIRAKICKNSTKYMCFRDINTETYTELCNKTDEIQQEGFKTVVRGSFDGVPCDENHYQLFKYSSSYGNTCVFLKSICKEEGQIESTDRQTTSDRTCRCDYRFGFSFVSKQNKLCFCVPSEEDCSCYYKECGKDRVLTPDYVCMNTTNITGHFKCPLIHESKATKTEETKVINKPYKDPCPRQKEQNAMIRLLMFVVGIQLGLLCLVISVGLIRSFSCNWQEHMKKKNI